MLGWISLWSTPAGRTRDTRRRTRIDARPMSSLFCVRRRPGAGRFGRGCTKSPRARGCAASRPRLSRSSPESCRTLRDRNLAARREIREREHAEVMLVRAREHGIDRLVRGVDRRIVAVEHHDRVATGGRVDRVQQRGVVGREMVRLYAPTAVARSIRTPARSV